jgi:hypothetical protein
MQLALRKAVPDFSGQLVSDRRTRQAVLLKATAQAGLRPFVLYLAELPYK